MSRSHTKRSLFWSAAIGTLGSALVLQACAGGDFSSCSAMRTCSAGGSAGVGGAAEGGQSGSPSAGATNTSTGAAGEGGAVIGASGAPGATSGHADDGEAGMAGRGAAGDGGAAGDAPGSCRPLETRPCSADGLVGKCAAGTETCSAQGTWGACSIIPAAADTCVAGNNDDCTGAPNEGCLCINGVTTKPCGACNDGTQVCSDGKTNQYGACTGAVMQPTTYYRDADGDGFGSAATTSVCGGPPGGYTDQTGDCCDDGGNLALAKTIFPGQTQFFPTAANICGVTWNYNCSAGGSIETFPATHVASCTALPTCVDNVIAQYGESDCGTSVCGGGCAQVGPGTANCFVFCGGTFTVMCH